MTQLTFSYLSFRDGCYTLRELKLAHVSAEQALAARFTVKELRDAGQFKHLRFSAVRRQSLPPLM
jgi:hypothetical protein